MRARRCIISTSPSNAEAAAAAACLLRVCSRLMLQRRQMGALLGSGSKQFLQNNSWHAAHVFSRRSREKGWQQFEHFRDDISSPSWPCNFVLFLFSGLFKACLDRESGVKEICFLDGIYFSLSFEMIWPGLDPVFAGAFVLVSTCLLHAFRSSMNGLCA